MDSDRLVSCLLPVFQVAVKYLHCKRVTQIGEMSICLFCKADFFLVSWSPGESGATMTLHQFDKSIFFLLCYIVHVHVKTQNIESKKT